MLYMVEQFQYDADIMEKSAFHSSALQNPLGWHKYLEFFS